MTDAQSARTPRNVDAVVARVLAGETERFAEGTHVETFARSEVVFEWETAGTEVYIDSLPNVQP